MGLATLLMVDGRPVTRRASDETGRHDPPRLSRWSATASRSARSSSCAARARTLAASDALDGLLHPASTSVTAVTIGEALEEIETQAGRRYDPTVIAALRLSSNAAPSSSTP